MDGVQDKLSFIQRSLDSGEYDVVVKECSTLFEIAFKRIFNSAIISLPFKERLELQEYEKKIGKTTKGVQDFTFGELVGLFRESNLMGKWSKHLSKDLGLINSLDYGPIVSLRNRIVHEGQTCSRYEAELIYNYLRNLLASLGLADLNTNINITKHERQVSSKDNNHQTKIFKYLPERGLIVNPNDNSRNISLKVETLNMIFDIIFDEIRSITDENTSEEILRKAGYESGKNFGSIMNEKWELDHETVSLNEKISLWCEFDSDVGWGKFINNLSINENDGFIEGSLIISENFLTYQRKKNENPICCFIKGYCEGVLEQILGGIDIEIGCNKDSCPQKSAFKKQCSLQIFVKDAME